MTVKMKKIATVLACMLGCGLAAGARADVGESARKIAEANGDAVVTVQLVIETRMSFGGESEKEERKVSAPGVVIDPSGLVVSSLSEIDPTKVLTAFMPDEAESSFSSEVVEVKIRLADGTEEPANVVLRDRDLDLAFLRPKKAPGQPMKCVDLSQAASPQLMDELVVLQRLGPSAGRSLSARVERVQAVVTKPRTFYVVDGDRFGCPVFAADGKPVGILVMRTGQPDSRSTGLFSMADDVLVTVLPCATIAKAAQHAKDAPPEKPSSKSETKPAPKAPKGQNAK